MSISILIVVPTLDSYALLPRLFASLRRQSFPNWRVVFIDGPSCPAHKNWLNSCCFHDSRCSWVPQDPSLPGIFGAMNQGFAYAHPDEWVLFWGSDDWAASMHVLSDVVAALRQSASRGLSPDLLVCRGRYVDASGSVFRRLSVFGRAAVFSAARFRQSLFLGSTPPHQATLFGPRARQRLSFYSAGFRLSADLDYFLNLSCSPHLIVQCLDLELVHMGLGGVSGQQAYRRLQEVRNAYTRAFGWLWWIPFVMRYLRRLLSLLPHSCSFRCGPMARFSSGTAEASPEDYR